MDLFAFPPLAALLDLAYSGLMALGAALAPLTAASAALAVVLVTLLVRAALIPTGIAQAKAEQTRARLAPRLRELQKKHKSDRERLQRETMQLYRDENTSPLAGCLPVLIQAPVVGVLYTLFLHTTIAGHPNALLDETLLGVPLGSTLLGSLSGGDTAGVVVCAAVVVVIALVGEITRRAFRTTPVAGDLAMPAVAGGLIGALQFVTAVVAAFVPLAAGLYLVVTVTWTLGQRLVLRRIYPAPRR
ncbi:YidC/Oxa1 family membrane protein insertase [Microbacterium sp. AG1240]|uniref:YidC/Oxa1 family membrane protein insertase n=1 Tax=Microbacterium sp. AG1240 TaxID=2183992 RepID=UPI000EAD4CFE|nr:membrane protein insertase YidC [Microbacterium sp. AG1240]RKT33351.1 YidC/Oxa1 family membrane protein insertase [Microbacterium sp. AG1240]